MNKLFNKYKFHYFLFLVFVILDSPLGNPGYATGDLIGYWLGGITGQMIIPILFILYCLIFKKRDLFLNYFPPVLAAFSLFGIILLFT